MTLEKAFRFVKGKRPIVNPNEGFMKQLKIFERELISQRFKEKLCKDIESNETAAYLQKTPINYNTKKLDITTPSKVYYDLPEKRSNTRISINSPNSAEILGLGGKSSISALREELKTRQFDTKNYHYTAGNKSYGTGSDQKLYNDYTSKIYDYQKKKEGLKIINNNLNKKSFLEQHLALYRPTVLQK